MRDFLLNLSKDLHIQQKIRVIKIRPSNDKIKILNDKKQKWISCDAVISTLPAPQNYQLLDKFPALQETLKKVHTIHAYGCLLLIKSN